MCEGYWILILEWLCEQCVDHGTLLHLVHTVTAPTGIGYYIKQNKWGLVGLV